MEIRVKRVMLTEDELMHYGVKGMKWGVRRYQNKDGSKNTNDDQLDGWGNLANRSRSKLAKLSGQSSDKISDDDRADFDWDVEGTEEARWVDNKKLSSKNPDDVKFVAKELVDFWDRAIADEKADYNPNFDEKPSTKAANYKKKYLNDPEAYAKAVIEEIEHIQKLRELDHSDDSSDELYHWGIKGMKWGVRRYQNKDGSLTAAGQKHRRSLGQYVHDKRVAKKRREAAAKARETKAKNAAEKAKREKKLARNAIPVKKMTDEELAASMKRLQNEQKYLEQVRETSTWKRFTHKFVNEVVIDGVSSAGKDLAKSYLKKYGEELLGIKDKPSAHDKLKQAAEASKLRKEMYENEQALENAKKNKELNDNVTRAEAEADLAKAKKSKVDYERQTHRINKEFANERAEEADTKAAFNNNNQKPDGRYGKSGSDINDAVYETGKTRVKNEIKSHGDATVYEVSKSNIKKGKAWVTDKDGNEIVPVDVTIETIDDDK